MVDQRDVRAGKKTPSDIVDIIEWGQLDDEMRLAHDERVENSQKPSIWEYNPKGGMPTELANLDPSTFLTSPLGEILCSLPKDVLARICSMLSVCDFVDLSLTCRFLHWRMFTFCTCYVPYPVKMQLIEDKVFADFPKWKRVPQWIYALNQDVFDNDKDGKRRKSMGPGEVAIFRQYLLGPGNKGDLLIQQPFCLRKPFFFEKLRLILLLPSFRSKFYDLCLPYILSVRGLARHLDLYFINQHSPENRFFDFPETNDFLRAINASYYDNIHRDYQITTCPSPGILTNNKDIYLNCPFARQMNKVRIVTNGTYDILDVPVFQNNIGLYGDPLDLPIIATLKIFLTGSTNLIYHRYVDIEKNNGRFPLIEYLFREFGEFEEFFLYSEQEEDDDDNYHIWKKVVRTENGGQLIIVVDKEYEGVGASVAIGKQEMFKEMDTTYNRRSLYRKHNICWKMETAVEPDEAVKSDDVEEPNVIIEPDAALDLNVTVETDIAVEPIVTVEQLVVTVEPNALAELDVIVVMNASVDEDNIEEKQRVSGACFCLNNTSCSIQ